MRRITWMAAIVLCLTLTLAGCGSKDAGSVVKNLNNRVSKLDSYQGTGKMTLNTGQEPQEYQVEVWYQDPHFYRISLTNEKKDITQIVLRNDEGVFVLTPHLNKSFRFQSDWPANQGQVYLYQSLVDSIVKDKDRQFTMDGNDMVFDVTANYQNQSLTRQKIWLDKKTYAPKHVEVSDSSSNVMVVVDFTQFEFGKKFDKDSFEMQRNLSGSILNSIPTIGLGLDGTSAKAAGTSEESKAADAKATDTTAAGAKTTDAKAASAADAKKAADANAAGTKATDAKAGGTTAAGTKATDTKAAADSSAAASSKAAADSKATDAKAVDAKATDAKATDAKASDTKATDTKATDAKSTDAKAAGAAKTGTDAKAAADAKSAADSKAGADSKLTTTSKAGTDAKAADTKSGAAAQVPAGAKAKDGTDAKAAADAKAASAGAAFAIMEPDYLPSGVAQQDVSDITLGMDKAVMLRYNGAYHYSLVESMPEDRAVSGLPGTMLDLGYTFGLLTGDAAKTLTWTYEGMEYRLSTADLPVSEMVRIAQSVQGQMGK